MMVNVNHLASNFCFKAASCISLLYYISFCFFLSSRLIFHMKFGFSRKAIKSEKQQCARFEAKKIRSVSHLFASKRNAGHILVPSWVYILEKSVHPLPQER
jgi:hypothetical protein